MSSGAFELREAKKKKKIDVDEACIMNFSFLLLLTIKDARLDL